MNLQAASALLKTLEEPPGQARLLLSTADEARLLPTVRSRCQRIRLAEPPARAGRARGWQSRALRDAPVLLAAAGGAPLAARELAAAGIDAAGLAGAAAARVAARAGGRAGRLAGAARGGRAAEALPRRHGAGRGRRAALLCGAGACRRAHSRRPLSAWAKTLSRVARHDEHPWNDGLLIEALVSEGRGCWQEATTRGPRSGRALDTLAR